MGKVLIDTKNIQDNLEVVDLDGNVGIIVDSSDICNVKVEVKETGTTRTYCINANSDKYGRLWITHKHNMIDFLKNHLETKEGKNKCIEHFAKIVEQDKINNLQLERFHINYIDRFCEIIEKIIAKYESDEYVNREYKMGREPNTTLYFFLFEYAEKYGRKCNKAERKKYGNSFTSDIFYINGYYIQLMNGQGSVIKINKCE